MSTSPEKSVPNADLDSSSSQDMLQVLDGARGVETPSSLKDFSQQRAAKLQRSALIKIIEGEIIPRLYLAHRDLAPRRLAGISGPGLEELGGYDFLADLFLRGDTTEIVDCLRGFMASGVRREQVYLEFLAPVPQALSILWSEGRCSFDEMAKGLCCVDRVLHEMHEREHTAKD